MNRKLILVGLLMSWSVGVAAETAYVTDILRLGLHQAENTSDRAFRTLVSGAELEVVERRPNYARVRTVDGQVGWVKSAYLVADKPAQLRVSEVEAEIAIVRDELSTAHAARVAAEGETRKITDDMRSSVDSSDAIQDTLARLKRENASYEASLETYRGSVPLSWVAAALLVALIGGFVAGMAWIDYFSRRRHGGFRIY